MVDKKMTKKSVSKLEATEVEISSAAGSVEAPKCRGRPPKKASTASAKTVAKRRGRPAKKVPAPVVDAADRPRRGRPVSVDALKARLARTRDALTAEKVKHRKQSLEMKQKLAEANAAKKKLKVQLDDAKAALVEVRKSEKAAVEQAKMEQARDEAVGKFVAGWEKKYLASATKRRKTAGPKRRGRPPKSR